MSQQCPGCEGTLFGGHKPDCSGFIFKEEEVCNGCGRLKDEEHFSPCTCIRCFAPKPSKDSPDICATCQRELSKRIE